MVFGEAANTGRMVGEAPRAKGVVEPLNTLASLVSGRTDAAKRIPARKFGFLARLMSAAGGRATDRAKA